MPCAESSGTAIARWSAVSLFTTASGETAVKSESVSALPV
jgi:hypothetical protein